MTQARKANHLPSVELLRELFVYDPMTGELMWSRTGRGRRLDRKITTTDTKGYLQVSIDSKGYRVHRVIWAMETGDWPQGEIDHRDCNKKHNRMENLRDCSRMENSCNSKPKRSGKLKGAFFHKPSGTYQSMIFVQGKYRPLGYFKTEIEAHNAYVVAAARYHGEFARAA